MTASGSASCDLTLSLGELLPLGGRREEVCDLSVLFHTTACESVVASELSLKNNKRGVEAEQESVDFRSTKFSNSGSTTYQFFNLSVPASFFFFNRSKFSEYLSSHIDPKLNRKHFLLKN